MTKGPTKAQLALAEAQEWIEASKMEVREREAALDQARSQLEMHETIYAILEKTFTRQPAKTTTKKASKKSSKSSTKSQRASSLQQRIQGRAKDAPTKGGPCKFRYPDDAPAYAGQACTGYSDNPIHDPNAGYAGYHPFVWGYHPFVSPSPARNAGGRSSSQNGSPDESRVNSEVETESASSATGD